MARGPGSLLIDVAERGSDVGSVVDAVTETLRSWIGVGPVFVATAEPLTGSFAGTFTSGIPTDAAERFFAIEMAGHDVGTFEALSRSESGMAALFALTDGRPESSQRWRDVIAPLNWGDEARAVIRAHGRTWGYVCLHREIGDRAFRSRDMQRLASLLPAVATALRTAALAASGQSDALETGVVLADSKCRIIDVTGAAAAWLAEFGLSNHDELPLTLDALCRRVLLEKSTVSTSVTTRTGRPALVEMAALQSGDEPHVAIVIRSAPADQNLQRFAAIVSLTRRETDVVAQVLRGLSTRDIAEELSVSVYTVQAHLTAVFAKAGVHTRRELVHRLHGPVNVG